MGGSVDESNALINTPSKVSGWLCLIMFNSTTDRDPIETRGTVGTSTPDGLPLAGRELPLQNGCRERLALQTKESV